MTSRASRRYGIEGDLPGVATHAGVELADVVSYLSTGGLDEHLAQRGRSVLRWRRALQSYDIRVVASEDRSNPGGAQQIRGAEDDARRAVTGDNALVVGELAVDQPAADLDVAQGNMQLVVTGRAAQRDGQARRRREGMGDLDKGSCRDDPGGTRCRIGQRQRTDREAKAIGSGQRQPGGG